MTEQHKMDVWATGKSQHENGTTGKSNSNAVMDVSMDPANIQGDSGSIQNTIKEFGEETTHHGIHLVTNPKYNILRRYVWFVIVLTADTYMVLNIVLAFISYLEYGVNTVVSVTYVEEKLDFPAVTLCNYNQFRKSQLDELTLSLVEDIFGPRARFSDKPINWTKYAEILAEPVSTDAPVPAFRDIVKNWSHQISDMIGECTWRGVVPCDWRNFTTIITDWGVCFSFNNPANKSEILKIQQSGSRNGLLLRLNVEQDEYVSGENSAAGFKVLLHPPGAIPLLTELGFAISPGFETSVAATYTKVTNQPHPYSNCTMADDHELEHYTVPLCQYVCKARYITKNCQCRDYLYPVNWAPTVRECNVQDRVECLYPYEAKFVTENIKCDCNLPCQAEQYEARTSIAYFPNEHLTEQLEPLLNTTEDYIRKNFLEMRVFFEELSYSEVTQEPAYNFRTLLSDIGGNMGLMAGMSLITVAETFDFIFNSIWKKFCRATHRT